MGFLEALNADLNIPGAELFEIPGNGSGYNGAVGQDREGESGPIGPEQIEEPEEIVTEEMEPDEEPEKENPKKGD